jgi:hypothetical protein
VHNNCSQCIQLANIPPYHTVKELAESLQLTTQINANAFHETLLNHVLPSIHYEVNKWHMKQCDLPIAHITLIITDPNNPTTGEFISASLYELNENIHKWTDTKCVDTQNFARLKICNEACENTVDLWVEEMVMHHIFT